MMLWLMTVQEAATPTLNIPKWPAGIKFEISPRRFSFDPTIGDEPPPNPNRFDIVRHWPITVEIRRPDGTRISAEARPASVHLNFPYALRLERDDAGRLLSPWREMITLNGLTVTDVPLGSEIWGDVTIEDSEESTPSEE